MTEPKVFDDLDEYLSQRGRREETKPKEEENPQIKELTKQMEKIITMMREGDDSLDLDELLMSSNDRLPEKFKMSELIKFDGAGDLKMHLRQYAITMGTTGLSKSQIIKLFVLSLQGAAMTWYHNLERWVKEDWKALTEQFVKKYGYNTHLVLTLRDLESTRHKVNQSFTDYVMRWRNKAMRMRNRPEERDQLRMVVRGALPSPSSKMQLTVLRTFEDVIEMGLLVEKRELENKKTYPKKTYGTNQTTARGNSTRSAEVHVVQSKRLFNQTGNNTVHAIHNRRFSNLGMSLSRVLDKLKKRGFLQPLPQKPQQYPLPPNADPNQYCHFHQAKGHLTDKCTRLHYEIHDLIDGRKIADLEKNPSINRNPLPNHQGNSPQNVLVIGSRLSPEEVLNFFMDVCTIDIWGDSDEEQEIDI